MPTILAGAVDAGLTGVIAGGAGGVFLNAILPRGAREALAKQRMLLRA